MSNDIKIQFTISMILYHFISPSAKLPIAGTDLQIVRKIENLYRMVVLDNVGYLFYCCLRHKTNAKFDTFSYEL